MLKVWLFPWVLRRLPEYSASIPTGTALWKTWRRRTRGGWVVGQYVPDPDPGFVGIRWREVVLKSGPCPTVWP